jgi:hypothetical protein
MKGLMKRSLLMGIGGYILLMLLALCAFAVGKISMRQLGVDYAILFLVGVVVLTVLLQRNRPQSREDEPVHAVALDTGERQANRRSVRNYIIAILTMGVLLIYGLWDSNGYPLWVTLIGASINVGIICVLSIAVRNKMRVANHGDVSRPK